MYVGRPADGHGNVVAVSLFRQPEGVEPGVGRAHTPLHGARLGVRLHGLARRAPDHHPGRRAGVLEDQDAHSVRWVGVLGHDGEGQRAPDVEADAPVRERVPARVRDGLRRGPEGRALVLEVVGVGAVARPAPR